MSKVWFITGSARGFGRVWTEAALRRGDTVVAAARSIEPLAALVDAYADRILPLVLDVTDKAAVEAAVGRAVARCGRLDVVVNNAGYGLFGTVEEVSEQEARAIFETNFFGALWVTQSVLPVLRRQRSGHIIQISSVAGVFAFPDLGLYNASKWALEGLSQALRAEVQGFGIHVTLVEPRSFSTDWGGSSAVHAQPLAAYDALHAELSKQHAAMKYADPEATGPVMLELADMDDPPLRVFLGKGALDVARAEYAARLADWARTESLSEAPGLTLR